MEQKLLKIVIDLTNAENLTGDTSRLYGDCSGLSGNIDNCELTVEERAKWVKIEDLIQPVQEA